MDVVKIEITETGRMKIHWSEMGEQCWDDADALYSILRDLGVDVQVEETEPRPMEAEEVSLNHAHV